MKDKYRYSIIVPVYNDEKRIRSAIEQILYFDKVESKEPFELLVICDGSQDTTVSQAHTLLESSGLPSDVIYYPVNRGKGYALKVGVNQSKGKYCVLVDVDLATLTDNFKKFETVCFENYPIFIGSRSHSSSIIMHHQPWYRRLMGPVFTYLANQLLNLNFTDYTCGFKGFRNDIAKRLFSMITIDGFAYDAELLFLAKNLGYSIREIPVKWKHSEENELSFPAVPLRMIRDLLKIKFNYYQGQYNY